ncbi:probable 39S ribosomal protein L45, mitochondrial [Aplysia californica]|uniref:Large ribosomal subunit protein mL45 n=1 Tax=Aplysia californica TaxID=6500 RepID=A0ABM0JGC7_APLCA|nr:probable 39S ribosomal protein L45, mitochondrial [Aplysia californica]
MNKMAAHMKILTRSTLLRAITKPAVVSPLAVGSQQHDVQQTRNYPTSKHYDLKWRQKRREKVLEIDLPKFVELKKDKKKENRTPDEIRMEMKKEGRLPPRFQQDLPINTSCTRSVIEPYKPKDGDGRQTEILTSGISDNVSRMVQGTKSLKHVRKLKKFEDFVESEFAEQAQNIVIETHDLLQDVYKNQERLHELVTEKAFPEMVHGMESKTMRWRFVESVEPPKVVQIRVEEMITQDNLFAQVTVRMHTKQILAIYDRFGRLMYGDPHLAKSVVEYVIMEKWISDTYGTWRIHGKVIPDGAPSRDALLRTYKVPVFEPLPPLEEKEGGEKKEEGEVDRMTGGGGLKPALA